jgi:hypothetical protein
MDPDKDVAALEAEATEFLRLVRPDERDARVGALETAYRSKFQVEGLGDAPAEARAQFRRQAQTMYDADLKARASRIDATRRELRRALDATLAVLGPLPDPRRVAASTSGSTTEIELRRVAALLSLDQAERRIAGRPIATVAALYERTPDDVDAALVYAIEEQARRRASGEDGPADPDVAGLTKLRTLIRDREQARIDRDAPALRAAANRLAKLDTITLKFQVDRVLERGAYLRAI